MALESDATFVKVNATTGVVSLSSILYPDEYRMFDPLPTDQLPAGFSSGTDLPPVNGRARKHDGVLLYEQRSGGWVIAGQYVGTAAPAQTWTVTPDTGDYSTEVTITVTDSGIDFSAIGGQILVNIADSDGVLQIGAGADVTDAHTVTAQLPFPSGTTLTTGVAYDVVLAGFRNHPVYATYPDAFTYV